MRRLMILVLASLLVVTGCAQIPVSGPIEHVSVSPRPRSVELAPEPPQPGVTPERLVEGFMLAMADPEGNYAVARQYLTMEAAEAWDPHSGARVYDGQVSAAGEVVRLSGEISGELDGLGRYTSKETALEHNFRILEEDGEWRISAPPQGLLLSRYLFQRYYAHVSIYFIARAGGWVVPDLIHVPDTQLTPARVVEAQLAGPSAMASDTVRNALATVPADALMSASIDNEGIATVNFSEFPETLPDDRRREVGAQLMWSLTAIPRVTGLRLQVNGNPWRIPGQNVDGVLELSSQQGYQVLSRATSPDLFGLSEGQPGRVSAAETFLPFPASDALNGLTITDLAVSLDGSQLALVDHERRMLLVGPPEGPFTPELPALERIDAVQFAMGNLWVLGQAAGRSAIIRYDGSRAPQRIDLSEVPGEVVSFSISQTGTRAALVVQRDEGSVLGMVSLQVGTRSRMLQWQQLHLSLGVGERVTSPLAVDWSAESELAVLGETGGTRSVFLTTFDGSVVEDLGPLNPDPVSVTALPRLGGDSIIVRSENDQVYRYEARTRWARMGVELQQVSFPG